LPAVVSVFSVRRCVAAVVLWCCGALLVLVLRLLRHVRKIAAAGIIYTTQDPISGTHWSIWVIHTFFETLEPIESRGS